MPLFPCQSYFSCRHLTRNYSVFSHFKKRISAEDHLIADQSRGGQRRFLTCRSDTGSAYATGTAVVQDSLESTGGPHSAAGRVPRKEGEKIRCHRIGVEEEKVGIEVVQTKGSLSIRYRPFRG